MSGPEESKVLKKAKILVDTTTQFLADDKSLHDMLTQWKSSIQWNDVIHGPVLEISEPFKSLTAFAERIHDDCAVAAEGGHVNDYQTRLKDLRAKAHTLHEAFKTKGASIELVAMAMKENKDKAFAEEGHVATKLKDVNQAMDALVDETKKQETPIAQLDEELRKISKILQDDLNAVTKAGQELDKETAELGHLRDTENKGLTGMKRMRRTLMLKKSIRIHEASLKGLQERKKSVDDQLHNDKPREDGPKAARAKYTALLLDLATTKNNLILQQKLLETAKVFAHDANSELTDTSDKWLNVVGNIGILNNRLDAIENKVLDEFIPTIADASDLVVRAANEGCRFLQYAGVEAELRATLDKIQKANDWTSDTDQVKTLKQNVQSVQGLIDTIVKELPEHATKASWFPQPLTLKHGSEEM